MEKDRQIDKKTHTKPDTSLQVDKKFIDKQKDRKQAKGAYNTENRQTGRQTEE